jgi:hypothetical protein
VSSSDELEFKLNDSDVVLSIRLLSFVSHPYIAYKSYEFVSLLGY